MTTRFHGYQHSCSVNFTVQLHASTSMSLLDIDKLIAELRLSDYTLYNSAMDVLIALFPGLHIQLLATKAGRGGQGMRLVL